MSSAPQSPQVTLNNRSPEDSDSPIRSPALRPLHLRPTRSRAPIQRLGNLQSYAARVSRPYDPDNPTYEQAMKHEDKAHWEQAMDEEWGSFVKHRVGRLVKRETNMNVIGGMWRLKRKRNTAGEITSYKARWVILGNHQLLGVDYINTYASVGVKESMYALCSLAAAEDLEVQSFDIKTAFLTGSTDVPVYTIQIPCYDDGSGCIVALDQAVYVTKQAHRRFNDGLKEKFASIGLHSSEIDDSLYSRWDDGRFVHIHMHVDDGFVVSNDINLLTTVKDSICSLYDVKWHDDPTEHLGVRIVRDRKNRTIHLSQEGYLGDVLERFGMQDSNPVLTPMNTSISLEPVSSEEHLNHKVFPYLEIIGCLNHAAVNTRPDLSHAVSSLAQFSNCFGSKHITAVKHILRFVKGTLDRGICFRQTSKPSRLLEAFSDADYANDVSTRRSTTGYTITLGGSTICWRTRRQRSVALSTTEAEYMSISDCAKHVVWFRRLLFILTHSPMAPTSVHLPPTSFFNDNNGAVFLSQEAALNSRSKHIDIRHHYIRDLVKHQVIQPTQIDTKSMPADYLTKAAGKNVIDSCRRIVGNISLSEMQDGAV